MESDEKAFEEVFKSANFKEYKFICKAQRDEWEGKTRVRCVVLRAEEVDEENRTPYRSRAPRLPYIWSAQRAGADTAWPLIYRCLLLLVYADHLLATRAHARCYVALFHSEILIKLR